MSDFSEIHEAVQDHYGRLAQEQRSCCEDGSCGDNYGATIPADLAASSLGCGDPVTLASLQPGQTVLDLGSGAGLDCFLAAEQVGPEGQVIGVDMTEPMLARANSNKQKLGVANVTFRRGQIEALPVAADSVDVVISNCVINLSPDKPAVFREAYRVLRPGGRLAVSDIVTQGTFTAEQRADMDAWASCITGAEDIGAVAGGLEAAGFTDVSIRDKEAPEVELAGSGSIRLATPRVFSARITAVKPEGTESDAYFSKVAADWDEIRAGFFTEAMRDAAIDRADLPPDAVVADVGTGTGFVLAGLVHRAKRLVGFDANPEMLAVARRNLAAHPHVELYQAAGDDLPAEGTFDAVFANMYLHHAPDPAAAIVAMARLLKPGGRLVITDLDSHEQEWMREAMADRWLGFARDAVREWYGAAGLSEIEIEDAEGTCGCATPNEGEIALGVFVALGTRI